MFRFQMSIAGETQIDRGIERFSQGVADYRPIWPIVSDEFYAEEQLQFQTEGAEGGQPWQALSPDYAGWKEKHFPGQPILQRTGALKASLTNAADANAINEAEPLSLTIGSRVPYGIYHQSIAPRTRLPRRPPVLLTEAFARSTMRNIQAYLVQVATDSGFRAGLGPIDAVRLASQFGHGIPPHIKSPIRRVPRHLGETVHHR